MAHYVDRFGTDIVLGVGGAVQGHPGGAAAGARAMRSAIDAAVSGIDVEARASSDPELAVALDRWGRL